MTYEDWCTYQWPEDYRNGLRVGQSYLNNVQPTLVKPELFYETDPVKAWDMIEDIQNGSENI